MSGNYESIFYEVKDAVCTITLNRPQVYNAFNRMLGEELNAAFTAAKNDHDIRAVVITGAGKAFCSGQDLKELQEHYGDSFEPMLGSRMREVYNPMMLKIHQLPKPVIAAVNGVAAGAGCSLALAADLRVMGEDATLIELFVNVGLVPDCGSTIILPRLVGLGKALELCFSGDKISAEEAMHLGLANKVVSTETVLEEAHRWALSLAQGPTKALGLIKSLIYDSYGNNFEQQLEAETVMQELADRTADHQEAIRAFIAKRQPRFQGK